MNLCVRQSVAISDFLAEVRAYAEGPYAAALFKGARLDDKERASVVKKLSEYTGLSPSYVEGANLRVEIMRFTKELLREQQQVIGRFDSRITGIDSHDSGENFESDPSMDTAQAIYSACLNDFVRRDLQFESDLPYEIISFKVHPKWRYDSFENQYVNTAEMLRVAMQKNPHLQVLVVNGLYDLATPFFATEYTFDHLGVRGDLLQNVKHTYYPAGHMMYTDKACLKSLTKELHQFVKKSS